MTDRADHSTTHNSAVMSYQQNNSGRDTLPDVDATRAVFSTDAPL